MKNKIDWKLVLILPVGENEVVIAYALMIVVSMLLWLVGGMSGLVLTMVVAWPVFALLAVVVSRIVFILWTGKGRK